MQKAQNGSELNIATIKFANKGWTYRGYLPHFDNGDVVQFVTFRLYDSVPEHTINKWKSELNWQRSLAADSKETIELYKRFELYADAGYGQCFLKDKRIYRLVENALLYFDQQRYELYKWKIMPNHVHLLCKIYPDWNLEKIVHSWKSYTSHQANEILKRNGQFWMEDCYDRYIRDEAHFINTVEYIQNNGK
ncbi:MAG: transposase [Planctomycetales bacterium]|nr:transposase [Planctomycetales bacterium]